MHVLVKVEDSTSSYFKMLVREAPREYLRALGRVGFHFKKLGGRAMKSGGTSLGQSFAGRSLLAQYKPFNRMSGDKWKTGRRQALAGKRMRQEGSSLQEALSRNSPLLQRGTNKNVRSFGSGRLHGAFRYKVDRPNMRLFVGFLDRSSQSVAGSLQGALRGTKGKFEFRRNQPVTERMRRMFWAAGVPLSKETKVLNQEERPLIMPLFRKHKRDAQVLTELYIEAYLKKLNSRAATRYVKRHLFQG